MFGRIPSNYSGSSGSNNSQDGKLSDSDKGENNSDFSDSESNDSGSMNDGLNIFSNNQEDDHIDSEPEQNEQFNQDEYFGASENNKSIQISNNLSRTDQSLQKSEFAVSHMAKINNQLKTQFVQKFSGFLKILFDYVRNNNLIVFESSRVFHIYCHNSLVDSNNLANLFAEKTKFVKVLTKVPYTIFDIQVDFYILCRVTKIADFRGNKIFNLFAENRTQANSLPAMTAYFNKQLYLARDVEMIKIYTDLYSLANEKEWDLLKLEEAELFSHYRKLKNGQIERRHEMQKNNKHNGGSNGYKRVSNGYNGDSNKYDVQVGDSDYNEHSGANEYDSGFNIQNTPLYRTLIGGGQPSQDVQSELFELISNLNCVLIGTYAAALLVNTKMDMKTKIQILTNDHTPLVEALKKLGINPAIRVDKIPFPFELRLTVTSLEYQGTIFAEIFNAADYEVILCKKIGKVLVACPFVICKFLFVELFKFRFLLTRQKIPVEVFNNKKNEILDIVAEIRELEFDQPEIFGTYYEEEMAIKEELNNETIYYPYEPFKYKQQKGTYREIKM